MLSSIYLTGGTFDPVIALDSEPNWRSMAMTRLRRYGLKVVNPLEFAWGSEEADVTDLSDGTRIKVKRALELIDQCDALLANLNRSSYGTAMEIFYASRLGKAVTVVGPSPYSPWVLSHSQARFGDIKEALDYIIEEQPLSSPLTWALQYETLLAERYEELPPAGEPDYKFLGGEIPVLVVAPHATAFWREGEFQEADAYTGSLAALLNHFSACHCLLTCHCCVADPYWHGETPFRRALADVVKAGDVGLVLMLLGLPWNESPGLQIYAGPKAQDYAKRLREKLMVVEPLTKECSALDEQLGALPRFATEELGVPTIVLKMHKRYRMPKLAPESFVMLSEILCDFVLTNGTELLRHSS